MRYICSCRVEVSAFIYLMRRITGLRCNFYLREVFSVLPLGLGNPELEL